MKMTVLRDDQKPLRQGDVGIVPASHPDFVAPTGKLTPIPSKVVGRVVLAYGEVTGHHHSFPAGGATFCMDEGGLAFLTVEELIEVTHQEHGPVPVFPGLYQVVIGEEYDEVSEEMVQTRD